MLVRQLIVASTRSAKFTVNCEYYLFLTCPKLSANSNSFYLYNICSFYKTIDGGDMLECDSIGHTEIDIIVKAFSYIVDGLNNGLGITSEMGSKHIFSVFVTRLSYNPHLYMY